MVKGSFIAQGEKTVLYLKKGRGFIFWGTPLGGCWIGVAVNLWGFVIKQEQHLMLTIAMKGWVKPAFLAGGKKLSPLGWVYFKDGFKAKRLERNALFMYDDKAIVNRFRGLMIGLRL